MFNSLFTTYEAIEPPSVVNEDTKLVQQNYKQFLQTSSAPNYGNTPTISFDSIASKEDPLKEKTDPPISFNEYIAPDTAKAPSTKLSTRKWTPTTTIQFSDRKDYARTMYGYLYRALEDNGIDGDTWAPILTAHTSIESGWGNEFSRRNNNFGGIKGKGSSVVSTKEWSPSKGYYTIKDTFKSYRSVQDFADDYVKKLKNRFKAFDGTPEDYLKNIRAHGYFTAKLSDYQKMFNGRLKNINDLLQN